jgi:ABC-2 type transport system ATP-binding protein
MIEIQHLGFGYKSGKLLFKDLSLTLSEGNIYGLLGKNGAGKSSLLKNIAGLLFPVSGFCKVNGFQAKDRLPAFLQQLYFIPEEFYLPAVSIKNFVTTYAPFYPDFSSSQFQQYLQEFQIEDNQKLTELSYGQKKKVLIGFGLATNTNVLIMDEPTNGLDIPSKTQFRRIMASAMDENRIIIISTHQVRDLESLIDPVIILDNSEILLHASIAEITEKLAFKNLSVIEEPDKVIYAESSLRGHAVVMQNTDNEPGKVDLELLFNAALEKRKLLKEVFTPQPVS